MAGLERFKPATWKFEGLLPRIKPIQNLRCTLSNKLTTHICPFLVCPKPLDQRGLHFRVPNCPLALGIEVGLIVKLGKISTDRFSVVEMVAWLTLILWLSSSHLIRSFRESWGLSLLYRQKATRTLSVIVVWKVPFYGIVLLLLLGKWFGQDWPVDCPQPLL